MLRQAQVLVSQIGIPSNPKPMEGKLLDVRFFTETFTGGCNYSSSTRNDVVGILGSASFLLMIILSSRQMLR